MNTNYTEALEQQARLLRMLNQKINSSERPIEYAGMGGRDFPQWFKIVSGGLTLGETYFLNEPVGRLIFQTANSLPEMRLSESLLSDRGYGFLWFSEPIRMPDLNGIPNMLRAISWCLANSPGNSAPDRCCLIPWHSAQNHPNWSPGPGPYFDWRFTETQREVCDRITESRGLDVDEQSAVRLLLSIFGNFLLFIEQRLLTATRNLVERHARKRLERDGWAAEPAVRIVELRRREHIGATTGFVQTVERDWACQWLVRGHWRQQFYPSRHANQPIWITPYVKGPDGKPLKPPRATVFAVVR